MKATVRSALAVWCQPILVLLLIFPFSCKDDAPDREPIEDVKPPEEKPVEIPAGEVGIFVYASAGDAKGNRKLTKLSSGHYHVGNKRTSLFASDSDLSSDGGALYIHFPTQNKTGTHQWDWKGNVILSYRVYRNDKLTSAYTSEYLLGEQRKDSPGHLVITRYDPYPGPKGQPAYIEGHFRLEKSGVNTPTDSFQSQLTGSFRILNGGEGE